MSDELSMFQITDDSRFKGTGWVKFYFKADEREFVGEAKVYPRGDGEAADGSVDPNDYNGYGVLIGSRVSKLSIAERGVGEVYAWDRGLDFIEIPEWIVEEVDMALNESLPR